ncbi:hypothetical protein HYH02_011646 [Chlamydomonas schloesseri]|uniref:non-specific serine/threonine protein kinase n=1 Tax=Chlamydomonas schloesseri TaxID=2026947 RepID=A0A835TC38_9CHLO|nr:hypothetical protein HYH02_011646 [Chlamydomonas schloesseri]|eukprot:KAG2436140.1 hypothetical protein HYH02_011646 [Chlamydomonas schloesseri]
MAGTVEAQGGDTSGAGGAKAANEEPQRITFLGRPALVVTLGTGGGAGAGARSHKRPRHDEAGDEGAQGGIRQVARSMLRAHKLGVLVPLVYHTDVESGRATVEDVAGRPLQALLDDMVAEAEAGSSSGKAAADLDAAAAALGRALALLHDGGQVHGGLGGGSVLLREGDGAVVLTDFRRSFNSIVALDKATDLAGLEAALLAAAKAKAGAQQQQQQQGEQVGEQEAAASAPGAAASAEGGGGSGAAAAPAAAATSKPAEIASAFFEKLLNSYRPSSRMWSAVHNKLAEVRARGTSQGGQGASAGAASAGTGSNKKAKTAAAKS